jgi:hypothetical protein
VSNYKLVYIQELLFEVQGFYGVFLKSLSAFELVPTNSQELEISKESSTIETNIKQQFQKTCRDNYF